MPYRLVERFSTRELQATRDSVQATLRWLVIADTDAEADDEASVYAFLRATAPWVYQNMWVSQFRMKRVTPLAWEAETTYSQQANASRDADGSVTYPVKRRESFRISGTQLHITQSLETVGAYAAPGETPPDTGRAIGVTQDRVEGTDIMVPTTEWTLEYTWQQQHINDGYKRLLAQLAQTTNIATWAGYGPRELLFVGAEIDQQADAPDESELTIRYTFAIQPTMLNIPVGDIIVAEKKGWDYLWVRYEPRVGRVGPGNKLLLWPRYAYVERVYEQTDFGLLGLG